MSWAIKGLGYDASGGGHAIDGVHERIRRIDYILLLATSLGLIFSIFFNKPYTLTS